MKDKRFLIASTGFPPYLTYAPFTELAFRLAKAVTSAGAHVRMMMPRFGVISERRLQLHEVIRLSGTNIVVDDEDIPLIIKVASIPKERMQVYFIDSMENFNQKILFYEEDGSLRKDLTDFMIFFSKSVVETAKKLNWDADYIITLGWFTDFLPLYLKTYYAHEPLFEKSKLIHFLVKDEMFEGELPGDLEKKFRFDEIPPEKYKVYLPPTVVNLERGASHYSDILMAGDEDLPPELEQIYKEFPRIKGKITLPLLEENPRLFVDLLKQFEAH
ncbi:MAG: glycogen/starch synthase [Chlorobi bacterium]|nr:glycogen/starch synthase [Chlorobiota bacterium]